MKCLPQKKFAVKILTKNSDNMKYFENELSIMRELDHPNVVNFVEIFVSSQKFFILMEYLSGNNLREYVK